MAPVCGARADLGRRRRWCRPGHIPRVVHGPHVAVSAAWPTIVHFRDTPHACIMWSACSHAGGIWGRWSCQHRVRPGPTHSLPPPPPSMARARTFTAPHSPTPPPPTPSPPPFSLPPTSPSLPVRLFEPRASLTGSFALQRFGPDRVDPLGDESAGPVTRKQGAPVGEDRRCGRLVCVARRPVPGKVTRSSAGSAGIRNARWSCGQCLCRC